MTKHKNIPNGTIVKIETIIQSMDKAHVGFFKDTKPCLVSFWLLSNTITIIKQSKIIKTEIKIEEIRTFFRNVN